MAIRVNSRTAFLAVALGLAACGNEQSAALDAVEDAQGPDGTREAAGSDAAEDCLLVIWEQRAGAEDFGGEDERAYDRAHDKADGGAISCATATSASQFEKTITALRDAAMNDDRAATLAQAGIPLLFIDKEGRSRELTDVAALEEAFDEVFTPETLERMRNLALDDMTVVPDKGGFFDLGALWLVVPETGGRPRLVTVNDQAFAEVAAIAARQASENGEGEEAPAR